MALNLYNDALDDTPIQELEMGFQELNNALGTALLAPGCVAAAVNVWFNMDGIARTRPGLHFISDVAAVSGARIDGAHYYDAPGIETVVFASGTGLYEVRGREPGTAAVLVADGLHEPGGKVFAQMVDSIFWTLPEGGIGYARWWDGAWVTGRVTQFKGGQPMPVFRALAAHGFRLFAAGGVDNNYTIFPSDLLDAAAPDAWDWLAGVRVGTGEGDAVMALISGQDSNLLVLNESSAWQIATTGINTFDWQIQKLTDKMGCLAGETAVMCGQDVLFLSRAGVVSLAGLLTTDTISSAASNSAPIQNTINRINWQAAAREARAVMWGNLYLLAVPVDGSEWANRVLAWHTLTRKWVGEWQTASPDFEQQPGGWGAAIMPRFGGRAETWWADVDGAVYRLDENYQKDDTGAGEPVDIESYVRTRGMTFGAQENRKQPFWLETEFFQSTSTDLTILVVPDDEQAFPSIPLDDGRVVIGGIIGTNAPRLPFTLPLKFTAYYSRNIPSHIRNQGAFRELAVIVHSKNGNIGLRRLRVAAFLDTVPLT